MASPLGGPAANLLVLLKVILLATLVVSAVAVGNVPGLKWSALEVWEGSASGDAWTRSLEYLDFRSYVLGALAYRRRIHRSTPERSSGSATNA